MCAILLLLCGVRVCLCVVIVCVRAGVCLRACVSVCALLLNLCYIYVWLMRCARACACKDVSGEGGG